MISLYWDNTFSSFFMTSFLSSGGGIVTEVDSHVISCSGFAMPFFFTLIIAVGRDRSSHPPKVKSWLLGWIFVRCGKCLLYLTVVKGNCAWKSILGELFFVLLRNFWRICVWARGDTAFYILSRVFLMVFLWLNVLWTSPSLRKFSVVLFILDPYH